MNIYWYWPFLRREELELADGVLEPGDRLVVHTTGRVADPVTSRQPACEVVATLPGIDGTREGSAAWLASRASTYLRRAAARRRTLRDGTFDIAHVIYLNPFTDAVDLKTLRRRVPLVCSVHDVFPHHARLPAPFERRLLGLQYRNAGTIVVAHDGVRRRLVREFALDPSRIVVVPLPIPESGPSGPKADGPPLVLFFGTLRRNKGVDVLLRAIEALRNETDSRFVLAGRGAPEIEQMVAAAADHDPRVIAEIGYATASRKHELYARADLVVMPYTNFESQSGILRDAYAARVPVVVSDLGPLGESVREDTTGWVVPPSDSTALASTILDALQDETGRQAAARAADAIARARTPRLIGRRLREVYVQVMSASTH